MAEQPEFVNPYDPKTGNVFIRAEHLARYLFAAKYIKKHRLTRVLDAACGNGYGSVLLASQAKFVTGVDRNEGLIEQGQCKIKASQARNVFLQAADLNTGFPMFTDGSFDCAVCFETLEHVDKDAELVSAFSRVLRRGGTLMLSVPKTGYEPTGEGGRPKNPYHLRLYAEDSLRELLGRSGLHVESVLGQPYANIARVRMEDYRRDTGVSAEEIGKYFTDTEQALEFYANVWAWPVEELREKSSVLFLVCKKIARN